METPVADGKSTAVVLAATAETLATEGTLGKSVAVNQQEEGHKKQQSP
jgi:hypothetical protein